MKQNLKKTGFTLIEMLIAIAIIVIVGAVSLVSMRAITKSFNSGSYAINIIDAALSGARATAIKEGKYAGVRFQRAYDSAGFDKASQYMIPIVSANVNDMNGTKDCYVAAEGKRSIKVPNSLIVMEVYCYDDPSDSNKDIELNDDTLNSESGLRNATTFTILFSPSGKPTVRFAQVRNKDGDPDPKNAEESSDRIFNSKINVESGVGRFYQDYTKGATNEIDGLWKEPTRTSFFILDRKEFEKVDSSKRCSDFISKIKDQSTYYLNPYNGKIIRDKK